MCVQTMYLDMYIQNTLWKVHLKSFKRRVLLLSIDFMLLYKIPWEKKKPIWWGFFDSRMLLYKSSLTTLYTDWQGQNENQSNYEVKMIFLLL